METQTTVKTYNIDPAHSSVEFIARHMMITKVRGRFAKFEGVIRVPEGSDIPTEIDVTIDASSIDTQEEQRDAHLRSPDFFDIDNHPHLTFKSKRIQSGSGSFDVIGDLTLHGVTREVILEAEFDGRGADPWGGNRVGYSASTKINRKDFGLNWNAALEAGGVLVSDDIKIELNVEAVESK